MSSYIAELKQMASRHKRSAYEHCAKECEGDIVGRVRRYRNAKKSVLVNTYGSRKEGRAISVQKEYSCSGEAGCAKRKYGSSIRGYFQQSAPVPLYPPSYRSQLNMSGQISLGSQKQLEGNSQHAAATQPKDLRDHSKNLYTSIRQGMEHFHERDTRSSDKTITKRTLKNDPNGLAVNSIPALTQLDSVLDGQKNLSIEDMHHCLVLFHQKCKLMLRAEEKREEAFDGNIKTVHEGDINSDEN